MDTYDLIIRNGTVVDGSGGPTTEADVAVRDGVIAAVAPRIAGRGREEIDASGKLVTPGFVDVHTHYDGQVTWSEDLLQSSNHGVTTVVVGNCGVGFAPCRPGDRQALVNVMEGVEDIPEAVMAEGLPWNWETFPQYLDALDARHWDIDVAAYLPHSPLRVYVMGQRGLDREPATAEDIARMQALAEEAMAAGAVGFSTSRTMVHRRGDGEFIPSFHAATEELVAIASAVGGTGRGVVQMIPNLDTEDYDLDVDLLKRLAKGSGRPVTYSLAQWLADSTGWRKTLDAMGRFNAEEGTRLVAQVFPRPMGVIGGLETSVNPFSLCPSYQPIADLPLVERVRALRDPDLKRRLLGEQPADPRNAMYLLLRNFDNIYRMDEVPDYEPDDTKSIAAMARARGISAIEMAYDLLLEDDGHALLFVPFANYVDRNLDATLGMIRDPNSVVGLGDGGAHYGLIADSSYTTTLLTHWTRDRPGERIGIPEAVKILAADTADLMGFRDRGRIAVGKKADINVIDHGALRLHRPRVVNDLPGGGRRMIQDADGYLATIVSGQIVHRAGVATGARPGRLVRQSQ
ncbi:MAG: amidohydrolase family protein [Pseudomonadota bacterium]|nr:amidohydrolase family protein [Pseudomonadota bacterium]